MAGLSLAEALKLATENPSRFAARRGRIEVGAPADLVRFRWSPGDPGLSIEHVIARGELVH
jgi:N-acetylglucosamine-6-phosphate deacetylase